MTVNFPNYSSETIQLYHSSSLISFPHFWWTENVDPGNIENLDSKILLIYFNNDFKNILHYLFY